MPAAHNLRLASRAPTRARSSRAAAAARKASFSGALAAARRTTAPSRQGAAPPFSSRIRGFDQTNAAEYESVAQARAWGYSTCSAAALTAVLRGAGLPVRIADVMQAMPGGLTPQLGLVSRPALVNAAREFGLQASDDQMTYQQLAQATQSGQAVLVDVTNGRFPEGHWLVVTGVSPEGVRVADSSRYDLTFIPAGDFLAGWSGRGIRIAPPSNQQRNISSIGERSG